MNIDQTLIDDFSYRNTFIQNLSYEESQARLSGFYKWLISKDVIAEIIDNLIQVNNIDEILSKTTENQPPQVSTPEEIAAIGIAFFKMISDGEDPFRVAEKYGISPSYNTSSIQDYYDELKNRYIDPSVEYIERILFNLYESLDNDSEKEKNDIPNWYPMEIEQSLNKFKKDYPDYKRNAFIMMRFTNTKLHNEIIKSIKATLIKYGINGLRADDKEYHDDLFGNVLTYLHGCSFGIAIFERLEQEEFNPNVSFEVGYMRASRKSICLLKDKTLKTLHTDLVGKLYKEFDPQDPDKTIPEVLYRWLCDKDILLI